MPGTYVSVALAGLCLSALMALELHLPVATPSGCPALAAELNFSAKGFWVPLLTLTAFDVLVPVDIQQMAQEMAQTHPFT